MSKTSSFLHWFDLEVLRPRERVTLQLDVAALQPLTPFERAVLRTVEVFGTDRPTVAEALRRLHLGTDRFIYTAVAALRSTGALTPAMAPPCAGGADPLVADDSELTDVGLRALRTGELPTKTVHRTLQVWRDPFDGAWLPAGESVDSPSVARFIDLEDLEGSADVPAAKELAALAKGEIGKDMRVIAFDRAPEAMGWAWERVKARCGFDSEGQLQIEPHQQAKRHADWVREWLRPDHRAVAQALQGVGTKDRSSAPRDWREDVKKLLPLGCHTSGRGVVHWVVEPGHGLPPVELSAITKATGGRSKRRRKRK